MRVVNSMSVGRLILINSVCALFVMIALGFSLAQPQQPGQAGPGPRYDTDGNLLRPIGFETWVFVGSNLGLGYADWARSMTTAEVRRTEQQNYHNVYIDPASYAAYVASSAFPEGSILVMDIYEAANKEMRVPEGKRSILNAGTFNGRRTGFEVAVKDSARPNRRDVVGEGRSVGEWAYYPFGPMSMRARANPDWQCYDCHRDHAADDKVWVQFYPVLRRIRNPE
jgi:hypothetical protein